MVQIPQKPANDNAVLTAKQLADYLIATDAGRMGVLDRAKNPKPFPPKLYSKAKTAIIGGLINPTLYSTKLQSAKEGLEAIAKDPTSGAKAVENARLAIDVVDAARLLENEFGEYEYSRPSSGRLSVNIKGVEVKVSLDLLISDKSKPKLRTGGLYINPNKPDAGTTDAAKSKVKRHAEFVCTIMHIALSEQNPSKSLHHSACMIANIQSGTLISAPKSYKARMKEIEGVCQVIASVWPQIP